MEDIAIRPYHDFHHRTTNFAGSAPGEIGGFIWRIESTTPEHAGYYGAPTGRLTMNDELKASGKVCFKRAAVDCGLLIGWFNSNTAIGAPPNNTLSACSSKAPAASATTSVRCMAHPMTSATSKEKARFSTPIARNAPAHPLRPKSKRRARPHHRNARQRVRIPDIPEAARKGNATFDHFGIVSWQRGGHYVEMYFDDVVYTSAK